ncbi:MAG TPA: DUF1559 domain-containing protein [Planctomicrobium sp.]|nr:DUF1559 domain-containing protein [Planctomicrobium sp.]
MSQNSISQSQTKLLDRPRRRRGFTAIELLVVIAIIAILIALLLPAVQQARESARIMQCRNNLMQLGLAIHNYHQAHQMLPPGSVNPTGPVYTGGPGYNMGWIPQILPFIDQSSLYHKIDFNQSANAPVNLSLIGYTPSLLFCPSSVGRTHAYVGCHHDEEAPIDTTNNGVLYLNSSLHLRDLTDGQQSTLLLGEVLAIGSWLEGSRGTLRNASSPGTLNDYKVYQDQRHQAEFSQSGIEEIEDPLKPDPRLIVGGFSSSHNGLVNCCFADGSVRKIAFNIDMTVFRNLANRHDGELIDLGSF